MCDASSQWNDYYAWNLSYYPYGGPITYTIDEADLTGDVSIDDTLYALNQAFLAWDFNPDCDLQYKQYYQTYGNGQPVIYDFVDSGDGYPFYTVTWDVYYANIVVGGFVDSSTWASIGGNPNNVAAAWPVTIRSAGERVDYDGNGYWDLAQVVIFFNDTYLWGVNGESDRYDIQTVAMHEIGHALGLHHSPYGADSIMGGYVSRGQVDHELGTWDIAMLESIYSNSDPPPVPEPSAILMCLLGLCFKPLFGKRSAK
jgi:hypothetical protein